MKEIPFICFFKKKRKKQGENKDYYFDFIFF